MNAEYKIENHSQGSTVLMLCNNNEWVAVVHFRGETANANAAAWVKHQRYLDRFDN